MDPYSKGLQRLALFESHLKKGPFLLLQQVLGSPEGVLRYFALDLFKEPKWLFSHSVCIKSKSGKLQKVDFLLTKPIEAYQYRIKPSDISFLYRTSTLQCAKYGGNQFFDVFLILIFWDIHS